MSNIVCIRISKNFKNCYTYLGVHAQVWFSALELLKGNQYISHLEVFLLFYSFKHYVKEYTEDIQYMYILHGQDKWACRQVGIFWLMGRGSVGSLSLCQLVHHLLDYEWGSSMSAQETWKNLRVTSLPPAINLRKLRDMQSNNVFVCLCWKLLWLVCQLFCHSNHWTNPKAPSTAIMGALLLPLITVAVESFSYP